MKLSIKITILFTGICLGLVTWSNAQVISLDSVLDLIDRQNPMLQQYDNKVKAFEAYSSGAKSWMPPMVGIGPYWYPYPGQRITDNRDKGFWMISAEQDIPNPAKLNAKKKYYASRSSVEEEGRAFQFNELRTEAKTLYYQLLIQEKKVLVLKENERIADLILKLAKIRYPYNQGNLGSIYKAEARLHEVENMISMAKSDIDGRKIKLKALMNVPATENIEIDTAIKVHFHPLHIFSDTSALPEHRSDVVQIDKEIVSMELNRKLQAVQRKPDFRIRFDHMAPRGSGMPQQFTLMGMISIPIAPWSSKMYKAETTGMGYEIEALRKQRESILIKARGELQSMSVQLIQHREQLENYEKKIIPALKKNYQTLMAAYEENREQLPIVIDGWEALNMMQMEYLNQLEEHYLMIANYEKELEK